MMVMMVDDDVNHVSTAMRRSSFLQAAVVRPHLLRKGMTKSYPGMRIVLVKLGCLGEETAGLLILLAGHVVAAHPKPGQC